MVRLVEVSALIREAVPPELAAVFAVITAFGGATGLVFLLSVLYWVGDRRPTALVVSFTLTALAVTLALKAGLGLPRPPASVQFVAHDADPYGFPSGHAVASVVVYGGLVLATERFRSWRGVAAATAIALLIGLSRVVIGVHYLGDVLVGFGVGLALLLVMWRVTRGDPRRGFAIAAVASLPALAVVGVGAETLVALGGSLGGVLGSYKLDDLPSPGSRLERGVLAVVGVGFVVALQTGQELLLDGLVTGFVGTAAVHVLANLVLVAGILLLPLATEWQWRTALPART
ncbi:PAP2 superfamily protein [Halogranum gelatinilyticum]|uniref:PAP2 superfamily protein n=1 Tax=Halogranum gelatinilyticum TaxID=660521 RepID=A0A1G9UU12_9EURY|nr:phosphatase PAP2 family protein [Halogranum gelatinilyticum]SDM63366.1 PAP2 superfamily protein [Halogranum gelatinilyticum]